MTTCSISPLRQRMIEDMSARKLSTGTQKGHLRACRRFAAFQKGVNPVPPNDIGHHSGRPALRRPSISNSKYSGYLNRVSFPYRVTVRPGTSACSCSTTW